MARKRNQQRRGQTTEVLDAQVLDAQAKDELEELAETLDDTEEVEDDETSDDEETEQAGTTIRPGDLAEELEMSPKVLRAWLRKTYPRKSDEKNTSWHLTQEQADAARDHFAPEEEDEDEVEELEELEDDVEVAS